MSLTKSKERIRDFGEVFTPKHIVNKMLDTLLICQNHRLIWRFFNEMHFWAPKSRTHLLEKQKKR